MIGALMAGYNLGTVMLVGRIVEAGLADEQAQREREMAEREAEMRQRTHERGLLADESEDE